MILITGSTEGLGRAVAHDLASRGEALVLHGRRPAALADLSTELQASYDLREPPLTVLADLASLEQVHGLAAEVAGLVEHLDVLVNNAGIGVGAPGQEREVSADGHELRFAVNHLAAFDLMLRLLPLLQAAPVGRIVQVASAGQGPVDFDDVMLERGWTGWGAYRQSKLAQVTTGFELAERLGVGSTVTVNSLHPGTLMPTKMVQQSEMSTVDTLETGVASVTRLTSSPELEGVTGRYFDRQADTRAHEAAYDPDQRRRLWDLSLELTGAPDVS